MKHILFFALQEDTISFLTIVEKMGPLKYIEIGRRSNPDFSFYKSGVEIPNLGRANNESASGCKSYLVAELGKSIDVRSKKNITGGKSFFIDQLQNPDAVTFTPAGLWSDEVVLFGRVATVSESVSAQELMKRFNFGIKKNFTKIKAFWIGPEARKLLDGGKRLTIAEQSPRKFDLSP